MPRLSLLLDIRDVHGHVVADPRVQVRLGPPDGVGTVGAVVALNGQPVRLDVPDGPASPALILRVTPTRFRDGAVTCTVDGSGDVTPMQPLRLPRRPQEWQPAFTPWTGLGASFDALRSVLGASPDCRLGQFTEPRTWVGADFDGVDVDDEPRMLAKLSLLNLYRRLSDEVAPGTRRPWFTTVIQMLLATRERLVAEVDQTCFDTVHDLARHERAGYRSSPVAHHLDNFRNIPGVTAVGSGASVKSAERKANLQCSVARVTWHGRQTFMLDADMDENGGLLLHTFDLIKHAFTGGTHPVDIHECLCAVTPGADFGYRLVPAARIGAPATVARALGPAPRLVARRTVRLLPAIATPARPLVRRAARKR